MRPDINLASLTDPQKDALMLSVMGQLQPALAEIAELQARIETLTRPPKPPDNSSQPPSSSRKANRCAAGKKRRRSSPMSPGCICLAGVVAVAARARLPSGDGDPTCSIPLWRSITRTSTEGSTASWPPCRAGGMARNYASASGAEVYAAFRSVGSTAKSPNSRCWRQRERR